MEQSKIENLWNFSFILMLIINALVFIGFTMMTPILPKYTISLGATMSIAGLVAGIFAITSIIIRPFAGFSTDRFNKKHLLVVSTIFLAVSALGLKISYNIYTLFFFRIVQGISFSVSVTVINALSTTYMPKERIGEGIGFMGLGYILATAISPNLGLEISSQFGFKYVFYLSCIIVMIAAALMTMIPYNPVNRENLNVSKLHIKISDFFAKELIVFAVLACLFTFMNGVIGSFLALLGDERHISNIGYYFTVNAIVILIIRPLSGKLLDNKGLSIIAFPAFIMAMMASLLLVISSSLWMILAVAVLYGIGQSSLSPALQATCVKKLGPSKVGIATSTYFIGYDAGQGLGPIIGGTIAGKFGLTSVFYICAALLFSGIVIYYLHTLNAKKAKSKIVSENLNNN
ncbi:MULTISPECIES: MFS transporter [Clostridium]|uniref:Predicted transport protein n=2 Tax=Clostridium TaxID=1485 RepID=D8GSS5_CLOLD|nr:MULTISPECIES: MFS transporter [Clostridium]ADK14495.1 predicted transport protein [Clostridium ljungdahlii DSM 13528]AGY77712.1 MFS transporter [Clostridium autoethanogenum DSM 10061]ALU37850.1 Major facilitator superfamily MFS_1 [Clostridium autoethanogenum DSM 10061]OAA88086.1 Purine efflux pump PbuE [Clostridium ljungdahlii DSM 13528]OVY49799.1 Purine efflux pump PbuE [Clostridium autoethanogenum]